MFEVFACAIGMKLPVNHQLIAYTYVRILKAQQKYSKFGVNFSFISQFKTHFVTYSQFNFMSMISLV